MSRRRQPAPSDLLEGDPNEPFVTITIRRRHLEWVGAILSRHLGRAVFGVLTVAGTALISAGASGFNAWKSTVLEDRATEIETSTRRTFDAAETAQAHSEVALDAYVDLVVDDRKAPLPVQTDDGTITVSQCAVMCREMTHGETQ